MGDWEKKDQDKECKNDLQVSGTKILRKAMEGAKFGGKFEIPIKKNLRVTIEQTVWHHITNKCHKWTRILTGLFDTKIKIPSQQWNENENYDGDTDEYNTSSANTELL